MNKKFRFKLNLFDGIVLVLGLCAALVLGYMMLKPAAPQAETGAPAVSTVRYTVRFQKMLEGTGALIQPGDVLKDNIKNYNLGTVESVEIVPATMEVVDEYSKTVVRATIEGYEDALVTVVASCTEGPSSLLVDGGYTLRVNTTAYVRGEGYMGSGPIISIEREGQA